MKVTKKRRPLSDLIYFVEKYGITKACQITKLSARYIRYRIKKFDKQKSKH